jgi:alanyl-tRNA synthetase
LAERKRLEKELSEAKRALAVGGGGAASGPEEINGTRVIARVLEGVGGKDLRPLAEDFKKSVGSGIVALVGKLDGKVAVTVAVTPDLTAKFNAAELARAAVIAMGGQGAGGKPDFAQGGAPDDSRADEGLAAVKALI